MTTQDRKREALKGARATKAANQRDREDRERIEERLLEIVSKERPDVNLEDVEFTFTGDLADVVIFIPDKKLGAKLKRGYRLKDGV